MPAARKLFEFHEGKVRLNPCCVAIHQQADGACRRDDGDLGIAKTCFPAELLRLLPQAHGALRNAVKGAVTTVERHGLIG